MEHRLTDSIADEAYYYGNILMRKEEIEAYKFYSQMQSVKFFKEASLKDITFDRKAD
jgi:hypothetical protein